MVSCSQYKFDISYTTIKHFAHHLPSGIFPGNDAANRRILSDLLQTPNLGLVGWVTYGFVPIPRGSTPLSSSTYIRVTSLGEMNTALDKPKVHVGSVLSGMKK